MKNIFGKLNGFICSFAKDEDGAQVVEYALIIAVVSIALVVALSALTANNGGFGQFITRVTNCLTGNGCAVAAPAAV